MNYSSSDVQTRDAQYNANVIAQYYRYRPWLAIFRSLKIIIYFGVFIIQLTLDKWFKQEEKNKLKRAEKLRKILTKLGPTFIKVGQALSTRPDLIRKDFLEELIKLQDQLPPFENEIAFEIIERELDLKIKEAYREISSNPVAAASLGQVYKAVLHTGEEVAVKVQRPNLLPVISLDLYLMRLASSWVAPFLPLNLGHDLGLIVDEFGIKLFEEIDYINEGRNAEKFATNFLGDKEVKVPCIYWHYTSHHVLTLEWINGYKLNDLDGIQAAGLDFSEIIRIGVTSGLKQLLEHGFFHADPHPGNLFAMTDGRMAYIDFGMMDQLAEDTKETIASSVVQLINRDYTALAKDFVNLGFLTPETDITPIIPALEKVLGSAIGQSVGDFNFKTITDDFSELMYEYPFRVPAKFALIIRSLVTQEGLALSLNPDFRIVEVSFPYVSRRLLTEESPAMRKRLIEVLFKNDKFQWERLENMIAIAQSDRQFDLLPTATLGIQFLVSEEGDYLRRQLITALIEDDRLHTKEVQRLWTLIQPELKPQKLFDVALQAIRQFSQDLVAS
ncbi:MAG: AarF/ABC1/UbiB kinase family protein [Cyanobacteria bacterium]|nr:AarF/ABC1/UbiB kinase family protein [Cyanobacteria bacterium CG_2015-16_32_12]NCO78932.1 AarF/ABC1/UbiB kinase family protein [Cyanobacteria bacterium CG_2015-22_32_23]NCQ04953.1 AarF/ABC1/UbiB kinase family protein [Cyanobacteria bacterium CG_2015-09_32_10]NCQ42718.1 AarF/ABC1/UbiB kinase family protein [Cyanobacteria bacterium CG_2015-04_32_10]NCS83805.1 AarF/ABC1/UbiB kinase family protein [Cyanobacteria bacterium CG_2015-02_32_10]